MASWPCLVSSALLHGRACPGAPLFAPVSASPVYAWKTQVGLNDPLFCEVSLSYLLHGPIQGSHLLPSHISLYRRNHIPLHRLLLALSNLHSNHLHPARDLGRRKDGDFIYFPNFRHSLNVLHTKQILPNHLLCVRHRDIAVETYGNTVCPHGAYIEATES